MLRILSTFHLLLQVGKFIYYYRQMANTPKEEIPVPDTPKDNRLKLTLSILSILIGLFLFISLASYISTWREDQDIVQRYGVKVFSVKDAEVENLFGVLGAYTGHSLIYNGFGIAAFLIAMFFFAMGINLFAGKRVFRLWRTFKYIVAGLLVISISLAFFTQGAEFSWGGATGELVKDWLIKWIGKLGTMILLITAGLFYVIWQMNPSLKFASGKRRKAANDSLNENETTTAAEADEAKLFIDESLETNNDTHKKGVAVIMPKTPAEDDGEEFTLVDEDEEEELMENKEEEEQFILTEEPDFTEDIVPRVPLTPTKPVQAEDIPDLELTQNNENIPSEIIIGKEEKTARVEVKGDYEPTLDLRNYKYPELDMLELHGTEKVIMDKEELEENKNQIINTLKNYDIQIQRISATVGPTVTLYEIVPAPGVRISRIKNLEDDIALSLAALGIRIIAPIPGRGTIGIEVPNVNKTTVSMRALISSEKFQNNNFSLPIAIGKKINNENFIVDLASMPHLLMAGATGQGKSVGINALLISLLYKKHPSQLKFVLVDPKKVELSIYRLIENHFLAKLPGEDEAIITDTKKVVTSLNALCIEMDNRYDLLKEAACRNIKEYNEKFVKRRLNPEKGHQFLPFIVLVIDEFADLIMTAGKEIELPIARLAQLARAVGIHLIIATQRPSVNIITGIIKANFPARIAFKVSSKIDSRTILDAGGAEQLIGKGDMLISYNGAITRLQCAFVDTPEVDKIVHFIGEQQGYPEPYLLPEYVDDKELAGNGADLSDRDSLFDEAAKLIVANQVGSTSLIQRKMKLGYNRAGRIMDQLEMAGIVGKSQGSKPRDVLVQTEAHLMEILEGL